jgi:hypothetical protein
MFGQTSASLLPGSSHIVGIFLSFLKDIGADFENFSNLAGKGMAVVIH